jgi:hypothetical protein
LTKINQAQRTLRGCSYDPIGRGRLDHKLSPFGIRFRSHFMAIGPQEMHVVKPERAFYLAASHRQIKKLLLSVLGASAVKILF